MPPPPPMLSFAQNGEDVVLRRAFAGQDGGFYVDVGACDPVEDSVTLHFYERGWRGINVEPDARFHAALEAARPRDVNLRAAVGPKEGTATFFPSRLRGLGTLDTALAGARDTGPAEQVPQTTLARILKEHAPPSGVDFLKVDVEGWEAQVLASADFRRVRPRVVLLEAVDPDGRPTHAAWEPRLLAAGYRFALFDGLNRFYCRGEDAERLLPRLAAPASVLDNYRLAREAREQDRLRAAEAAAREALERERAAHAAERAAHAEALEAERVAVREARVALDTTGTTLEAERAAAREALRREAADRAAATRALEAERAARASAERAAAASSAAHAQARAALEAEAAARAACDGALAAIRASTSWRVTEPLRAARRAARQAAAVSLPRRPRPPGAAHAAPPSERAVEEHAWSHSVELGDGTVTPGRQGPDATRAAFAAVFGPVAVAGRSVLAVGARDGAFAAEAKRRGARRVLATDGAAWASTDSGARAAFDLVRARTGLDIEARALDAMEVRAGSVGFFDVVLFLDGLHRLLDPVRALQQLADVAHDALVLETRLDVAELERPAMAFYPADGGSGEDGPADRWGPNAACVEALLRSVGFARTRFTPGPSSPDRGVFHAWKA